MSLCLTGDLRGGQRPKPCVLDLTLSAVVSHGSLPQALRAIASTELAASQSDLMLVEQTDRDW
ncbi:hypothetical protein EMEDMD4_310159 [Sinorhizobium medicae]|uniref:Uncharacterized protein n=1 Tax=Sinorhizobium medicae TaxID=110321 RepID=A0A508WYU6_9HYPH|nr:hypothetical protein EMEDMD4_310159 [Sinorhizobium medicae]